MLAAARGRPVIGVRARRGRPHSGGREDVRPEKQRLLARNAVRCVFRTQGRSAAIRCVARGRALAAAAVRHGPPSAPLLGTATAVALASPASAPCWEPGGSSRERRRRGLARTRRHRADHPGVDPRAERRRSRSGRRHAVRPGARRFRRARPRRRRPRTDHASSTRGWLCLVATIEQLQPDIVLVQNYVLPLLEAPLERASLAVQCAERHRGPRSPAAFPSGGLTCRPAPAGPRRRRRRHPQSLRRSRRRSWRAPDAADVAVLPLPTAAVPGLGREPAPDLRRRRRHRDRVRGAPPPVQGRRRGGRSGIDRARRLALRDGRHRRAHGSAGRRRGGRLPEHRRSGGDGRQCHCRVLFPYRFATQSAAVVFAQQLGVVPVASAVGGIAEQIDDGVDGLLLPPDAGLGVWREALATVRADHDTLAEGARRRVPPPTPSSR